ncbi:MAG: carbon-nitrogen hydrolase family protein [Gemmatimonadales bacterium]|nr:carbon-nitrogen hydrolase family protein [Gemmatimonadales bacterium]NIN13340.1 carbon-nitrogen hydrolase family protein [Gemmatimonadales bacterium]NIN51343.1 carbon-nitrogen hydrolase family protein [Gemmatimonadales bacterium]NIP08807.1 carbon-nitrogen hydrolase family protein [Gemmatimonadales bacterium]NIQ99801.1 carbon-nitrogen hydrolase family protein [Gemmatimonadales bacterium]
MTVRIALAQMPVTTDAPENLQRVLGAMESANSRGARLIAFPELALYPFFPQYEQYPTARELAEPIPGPTTEAVAEKARELELVTVLNMYEAADGRYFDSSPVFDADGAFLGTTRMVHITDYACFHERAYYAPGDRGAPVYATRVGRVGVAICYDRHYPEYMRALGVGGAELVVIPQAGALDEWPEGMFEAEVRAAAFQNGYFAALCNRVGREERLTFAGESFVVDPTGHVLARGNRLEEDLVIVDLDLSRCASSPARTLFWNDRRPELYRDWLA